MATQQITLKVAGETLTAVLLPVDHVAFERKYGMGMGAFAEDPHVEYIIWLAWHALKRTMNGQIPAVFDDFLAQVEDLEDPDDAEVPTLPPPTS